MKQFFLFVIFCCISCQLGAQVTSATPTSLSFPWTFVGASSPSRVTTITGSYLSPSTGNLTVTAPSNFKTSLDGSTWVTSFVVEYTGATLASTSIYVQCDPTSAGIVSGNLSITGGGATTLLVPLNDSLCATTYTVIGGGITCGSFLTEPVGLSGSDYATIYQLYNGASTVGSAISGTGSSIFFGHYTTPGTYRVVATGMGGCTTEMADSVTISTGTLSPDPVTVPFAILTGSSDTLHTTGPSPTWGTGYTTIVSITSSGIVTGLTAGLSTIFYNSDSGCNGAYLPVVPIGTKIADSFYVITTPNCDATQFKVVTNSPTATLHMMTYFGDGSTDYRSVGGSGAYSPDTFNHVYGASGTYTVKHVLFYGSTAMDSISYSYRYSFCRDISLSFYLDANSNCLFDTSTEHLNYFPLSVELDSAGVPLDTFSVTSGLTYTVLGSAGTVYSVRLIGSDTPLHLSCVSAGIVYDTISSTSSATDTRYIALNCSSASGFDLAINTFQGCGRHRAYGNIAVNNARCTAEDAVVTFNINPKYIFQYAYPWPTSVVGNTVKWDFSGVSAAAASESIYYDLVIPTSTWLTPGDTVLTTFVVAPTAGDADTTNNWVNRVDTVTSSFDPNAIAVNPDGYILNGTQLHYAIHFENDGNDTAQNIYVMDTLADNLVPSTLRLVAASAAMNITTLHNGGHTIMKFEFPNIKLLDSSHHGQCAGYVMYTIKTRTGLADGTLIYGHAGIYFDDNPVVLTDSSLNIILIPHLSISNLGSDTVCYGDTVHFAASPETVNITHYQWIVNGIHIGPDSSRLSFISTGTDTVKCMMTTIMDDTLYATSNQVVVVDRGITTATISGAGAVCSGATVTLSASVTTGSWSVSNTHATISSSGVVNGISAGIDTVLYTLSNPCGSSVSAHPITINSLPFSGSITGVASVCVGSTISFTDSVGGGAWSAINSHLSNSGASFTGVSAGVDTVVYSVSNSCGTSIATRGLTVNPSVTPSISITHSSGDTVCGGDTVTFTPVPVNGGSSPSYTWRKFSTIIGTGSTLRYTPANGDAIRCIMASNAACPLPDTVTSANVIMVVDPTVTPTNVISTSVGDSISYLGQVVAFHSENTYCGYAPTYQWYLDGAPVVGATSYAYSPIVFTNDTVYCISTCNTPCATTLADTSNIIVIYADYLSEDNVRNVSTTFTQLALSPNPNNGNFTISGQFVSLADENIHFDVSDITGRVVYNGEIASVKGKINAAVKMDDCTPGQYILRLVANGGVEFLHFVVGR